MPTPVSRFVNLREAETEREQPVLLAYRPGAREIKAFTQPQHGLEPPDRSSCCVEGLKAADPRHTFGVTGPVTLQPRRSRAHLPDAPLRGSREAESLNGSGNGRADYRMTLA
jgi:hypothetical protein